MKKLFSIFFIMITIFAEGQISMTYLQHWQLTPSAPDSSGVFCRTFYHAGRDKYYSVYAGRPTTSGAMQYFKWKEFDAGMNPTGLSGTLSGLLTAGDYAMEMVGTYYYHVTAYSGWTFKLSKYDDNFNLVNSVLIPLDSCDSQADMMMNYTNGKLIIGAFHEQGTYHPTMPMQSPSWTPVMHKFEYDLNLNQVAAPVYLNEIFDAWGASCIYNNNQYNIVTMSKWPNYHLNVYRYNSSWNFVDSLNLNMDGQWSQGLIWDGTYYYVSYHSGHEHRSGNITLAVYDINWSLVYDTTITNNAVFVFNTSPALNTTQYNANRPYMVKRADTLIVSYDQDDYQLTSFSPLIYAEGMRWNAHVVKMKINGLSTGMNAPQSEDILFSYYPNPCNAILNVNTSEQGDLRLYNSIGEMVLEEQLDEGLSSLPAETLSAGIYFIRFESGGEIVSEKLLVQ